MEVGGGGGRDPRTDPLQVQRDDCARKSHASPKDQFPSSSLVGHSAMAYIFEYNFVFLVFVFLPLFYLCPEFSFMCVYTYIFILCFFCVCIYVCMHIYINICISISTYLYTHFS